MKKGSETIELRDKIFGLFTEKLSVYGFKLKNKREIIKKCNNGFVQKICYIGNIDKIDKRIYTTLDLNVYNTKVDKLVAQFTDFNIPWPILNIGYLMPCKFYNQWSISTEDDIPNKIDNIITNIVEYGIPFMDNFSNDNTIINTLEEHPYIGIQIKAYLLPLMYYLYINNKGMALNCIAYYTNMYKISFEKKHNNDDCFWNIPLSSEEDKDSIIYENYVKVLKKMMEEGRTLE